MCGVHAVHHVSERLPGETGFLPIIQHVALANNHVHSPQMGPYLMPAIEPLEGTPGEIGSYHISDAELTEGLSERVQQATGGVEATKGAFHKSLRALAAPAAEHYYLWLLERLSPGEALDQLLPLGIARNGLDDHNFLFPVEALSSHRRRVLRDPGAVPLAAHGRGSQVGGDYPPRQGTPHLRAGEGTARDLNSGPQRRSAITGAWSDAVMPSCLRRYSRSTLTSRTRCTTGAVPSSMSIRRPIPRWNAPPR